MRTRRPVAAAMRIAAVAMVLAACDSMVDPPVTEPPGTPETVSLSRTSIVFAAVGDTARVSAVAKDAAGNVMHGITFSWLSSDATVARVSTDGVITARGDGTTTVTVWVGTIQASAFVTVAQVPVGLRITPDSIVLSAPGDTMTLTAGLVDARGATLAAAKPSIAWSTSDSTIATVSSSGLITAVGSGDIAVYAVADSFQASARVTSDDFGDLGVGWIHRSPELDYVWDSTNPTRDGWPAEGQVVTWEALAKNWSAYDRAGVGYRWWLDGVELAEGTVDMPAGEYVTVELARPWSFTRGVLRFELDPGNAISEVEERNNTVEVFTDALSVAFYVEHSLYDFFAENQWRLGIGSNSLEDWAQRHIRLWNRMFENARFPLTPDGVIDRLRLDKIVIVSDGALPLSWGQAANHPNAQDRSVDLQWGFPSVLIDGFTDLTSTSTDNSFYYAGWVFHELGHARYLVDVYGFNVKDGQWTPSGITDRGSNIAITEGGALIVGTPYMPIVAWEHVFYTSMPGLMNTAYTYVDEYSAAALNFIAGRRAVLGNMNAPGNLGAFLNDLPAENRLTIRDSTGAALAGASVEVYQAAPRNEFYGKFYDDEPDIVLTSNSQGQVLLGRNPFGGSGIVHTFGHSNAVVIIRVEHQGRVAYGFLEAWRFNMEYWRGNVALGDYHLTANLR